MPAPVVYVVAAVVTVGAILAFKELVYDTHLHHRVTTWVEEFQDDRRRRRNLAQAHAAQGRARDSGDEGDDSQPLVPIQTARQQQPQNEQGTQNSSLRRRRPQSSSASGVGGTEDDSDEERYGVGYNTPPWRAPSSQNATNAIELADLAPEIREWGSRTTLSGTRSPLDESNHSIPFVPMQPSRRLSSATASFMESSPRTLHVIANDDSPASTPTGTPSMARRMQALPQVPQEVQGPSSSVLFSTNDHYQDSPPTEPQRSRRGSPAHTDLSSLITSPPLPLPTLPPTTQPRTAPRPIPLNIPRHAERHQDPEPTPTTTPSSLATPIAATPIARPILSSLPSESGSARSSTISISPTSYRQTFPAHSPASSVTSSVSPPPRSLPSPTQQRFSPSTTHPTSPPLRPAFVPSLSQIYPQDLDSEHNVVLLSPPSSRSESPFSVVSAGAASPRGIPPNGSGLNSRSLLIDHTASSPPNPFGEEEALRTPGSTTSNYLSLADSSPSSPASSTPRSPSIPLSSSARYDRASPHRHGHGSDEEGSEFDFDIISDTTSLSGLTSPTNPSSPFIMSPFASPRMGRSEGAQFHQRSPSLQQHQQPQLHSSNSNFNQSASTQTLSPRRQHQRQHSGASDHAHEGNSTGNRPTSPAVSTTSLSDLDLLEYDDAPW